MTSRAPNELQSTRSVVSRRGFLEGVSVGIAGSIAAGPAGAETLADVPPREVGADLGPHSERSKFVHLSMLPEAGPGKRNLEPSHAINSKSAPGQPNATLPPTPLPFKPSHSSTPPPNPTQ